MPSCGSSQHACHRVLAPLLLNGWPLLAARLPCCQGGALFAGDVRSVNVSGCSFVDNGPLPALAGDDEGLGAINGGGIAVIGMKDTAANAVRLSVQDCTFEGNAADCGAGLYVNQYGVVPGRVTVLRSHFEGHEVGRAAALSAGRAGTYTFSDACLPTGVSAVAHWRRHHAGAELAHECDHLWLQLCKQQRVRWRWRRRQGL